MQFNYISAFANLTDPIASKYTMGGAFIKTLHHTEDKQFGGLEEWKKWKQEQGKLAASS